MVGIGKKGIIITGIIVPIVILILIIPILINSVSNLQQNNQEKENAKKIFIPEFVKALDDCYNITGTMIDPCKEHINFLQSECNFYDNPPVCGDIRIDKIKSATYTNVIIPPSTDFLTYTNNQYGFSINYPSNWIIDNNLPDGNIGLKDKMSAPNVLFEIKQIQNTGGSFDGIVNTYINQAGVAGYPITLQSKDKVIIGNKDAYKIQYTETIGSVTCKNEDYVINNGSFLPVIRYNSCDTNLFSQFLPIYESIVNTFR
jgi:hypothetical protein